MDKYKELAAELRAEWLKPGHKPLAMERAADALEHLVGIIELAGKQEAVASVDANDDGYWADIMPDRSVYVGQYLFARPDYASAARIKELEAEVARLKTVPMKYRRMKFNAELQDENTVLKEKLRVAREALKDIEGAHSTDRLICKEALAAIGEK